MATTASAHHPADSHPAGSQRAEKRARTGLALLAVAQLMLVLDVTVVNVALPDIGADLDLTSSAIPWVMTSYTLFFGGLMLLGGRLADLFGARRMTLTGLALFTISSLACALSRDEAVLLAGRASQGVGAAIMSPAALATALALFDEQGRAKALGVWSALAGVGSVLGVILGGILTGEVGWRWVFAINLPIGVALLVVLPVIVPASTTAPLVGKTTLDLPGAVLVTAGTGAAIYGLTAAGTHGWHAASTILPLIGAACLWALFAMFERRTRRPLLRVDLLGRRPVLAGSFLMLVATGLLVGGFFLGSFTLQHARGYSALRVGLYFLPIAAATGVGAHVAGRLLIRTNTKVVATTGLALAAGGYAAAADVDRPRGPGRSPVPRRPRHRRHLRHRLHSLAQRRRGPRGRPPISPGEHLPRAGRRRRRGGALQRGGHCARRTRGHTGRLHRRLHDRGHRGRSSRRHFSAPRAAGTPGGGCPTAATDVGATGLPGDLPRSATAIPDCRRAIGTSG